MIEFSLLIILPLIATAVCYFVVNKLIKYLISLIVSAIHLGLSLLIFSGVYQADLPMFFGADALSKLFLVVLSNVYFWVVLVSYSYLKERVSVKAESGKRFYFLLLNFYLFANTAAILSNHFGMYWVCAEATTLSVAPLIYYYRNESSLEAMWKYLFMVSVGIAFAFIGMLFLTLSANGTAIEGHQLFFSEFIQNANLLNPVWLKASFIFFLVGLSPKIGIAPLHPGDIDATSNSPSTIAALMSASLRGTALLGVLRILQVVIPTSTYQFAKTILIIGGLLSLAAAFVYMFKANNYKRLLAYSSVEHLGIITLGIGIGGLAFVGAMYHLIFNSINKVVIFFCSGVIHRKYKSRKVAKVSSVLNILPWTGWLFLLAFFAISGIPPFGIFFSELMIFEGILYSDQPWILAVAMFLLLFIFINMGKTILYMLYHKSADESLELSKEGFSLIHLVSIILLGISIAIAVLSPDLLQQNIAEIVKDFGIKL